MNTLTVLSAVLFFVGFVVWVSTLLERYQREHGGLAWFELLARRLPSGPDRQGDRDLARTLDDLRAASQRDPRHHAHRRTS